MRRLGMPGRPRRLRKMGFPSLLGFLSLLSLLL